MQQSSTNPSPDLAFWGLRKIVAFSQPYLAVPSCIYSFWYSVSPYTLLDFYTRNISKWHVQGEFRVHQVIVDVLGLGLGLGLGTFQVAQMMYVHGCLQR